MTARLWIEIVDMPYPAVAHMPTRKMRARYAGPVTILRRRRHYTFEVDVVIRKERAKIEIMVLERHWIQWAGPMGVPNLLPFRKLRTITRGIGPRWP